MYLDLNKRIVTRDFNVTTIEEAFDLISIHLQPTQDEAVLSKPRSLIFAVLMYLGYCITPSELTLLFGSYFANSDNTRMAFKTLLAENKCYRLNWTPGDMGAKFCGYALTAYGYNIMLRGLSEDMKVHDKKFTVRRTGGMVPLHDYGVGLSVLSLLRLGSPFSMHKECSLGSENTNLRVRGNVMVDALIRFNRAYDNFSLYLEQDTGTESVFQLTTKLDKYDNFGLMFPDQNAIIISSHYVQPYSKSPYFIQKWVTELLGNIKASGSSGVYDYYTKNKPLLSSSILEEIEDFLIMLELCYRDSQDPSTLVYVGDEDFSISDLECYLDGLANQSNAYQQYDYIKAQNALAAAKTKNLAYLIVSRINDGKYDLLRPYLNGYSTLVIPSVTLSTYVSLVLPHDTFLLDIYKKALSLYLPLDAWTYNDFYVVNNTTPNYPSITFRNVFVHPETGRLVAIEHIGRDLGAIARIYTALRISKQYPSCYPIIVVGVCSNHEEASAFCSVTGFQLDDTIAPVRVRNTDDFQLFLLNEEDIADGIAPLSYYSPVSLSGSADDSYYRQRLCRESDFAENPNATCITNDMWIEFRIRDVSRQNKAAKPRLKLNSRRKKQK